MQKKNSTVLLALTLLLAILQTGTVRAKVKVNNEVVCPDHQSKCPDGTTCCDIGGGQYGCCPLPNAVCCSDHVHCCPEGTRCEPEESACLQGSIKHPIYKKLPSTPHHTLDNFERVSFQPADAASDEDSGEEVECPDHKSKCPAHTTCCPLDSSSGVGTNYGCCPAEEAVCCEDKIHCCPHDTKCNLEQMRCDHLGSGQSRGLYKKFASTTTVRKPSVQTVSTAKKICDESPTGGVEDAEEMSVVSVCESGTKCCTPTDATISSAYCCPFSDGTCCPTGGHCCPKGFHCSSKFNECVKREKHSGISYHLSLFNTHLAPLEKAPSQKGSQCGDGSYCDHLHTCCPVASGKKASIVAYTCCPLSNKAKCCASGDSCCPRGYRCVLDGRGCEKEALYDTKLFLN